MVGGHARRVGLVFTEPQAHPAPKAAWMGEWGEEMGTCGNRSNRKDEERDSHAPITFTQ
jgi:hypothetical protein